VKTPMEAMSQAAREVDRKAYRDPMEMIEPELDMMRDNMGGIPSGVPALDPINITSLVRAAVIIRLRGAIPW